MQDAKGNQIAQFYEEYREVVPLDEVAEVMKTAIISIEDYRFYEHGAIDIEGTIRALAKNLQAGGVSQGGSSITQQYVKQVLLNSADTEEEKNKAAGGQLRAQAQRAALRDGGREEVHQGRDPGEVPEHRLLRRGAYGIEAAAKRFFGVPAADLTLPQAATLAGAVQDPNATDPNLGKSSRERLLRPAQRGARPDGGAGRSPRHEAAEAKAKKLGYKGTKLPGGCEASDYPYFCIYVRNEMLEQPGLRQDAARPREQFLNRGGLTIKTTIDPKMQKAADKAIKKCVIATDDPVAAEALVEPGTGADQGDGGQPARSAEQGARTRSPTTWSPTPRTAAASASRPGSTFKAFTLLTALKRGHEDQRRLHRRRRLPRARLRAFKNCKGETRRRPDPHRHQRRGRRRLQDAADRHLGLGEHLLHEAGAAGRPLRRRSRPPSRWASSAPTARTLQEFETFTLGINEMDPVTVATAYAAIARPRQVLRADGDHRDHRPRRQGHRRTSRKCQPGARPGGRRRGRPTSCPACSPRARCAAVGGIGRDAAGKTGTTDGYAAAWFAGFTPDLAGAVSLGDPRGSSSTS